MVIFENLRYLGREGFSLRVHNDLKSITYQLLLLQCKNIPDLNNWLLKKKGKCTDHDIQNELLKIISTGAKKVAAFNKAKYLFDNLG